MQWRTRPVGAARVGAVCKEIPPVGSQGETVPTFHHGYQRVGECVDNLPLAGGGVSGQAGVDKSQEVGGVQHEVETVR